MTHLMKQQWVEARSFVSRRSIVYMSMVRILIVRTVLRASLVAIATCTVHATVAAPLTQPTTEIAIAGYAVPIGGGLKGNNEEVWARLVHLAGGKGAKFAVFGLASEDPEGSARQAITELERRGAVCTYIPVSPQIKGLDLAKAVRDPLFIEQVSASTGVFFTGGAQERIVDTLQPGGKTTPLLDAVRGVQQRGGVVAGTSAGAAIMSAVMFRDAPEVLDVMKGKLRFGKEFDRGLGFASAGVLVDQHFLRRGRIGRLIPLMRAQGYQFGLGVEENSAAIFHGDEIEVMGAKGALLIDLSAAVSDPKLKEFNLRNARLSFLDRGDRYNIRTRTVLPSSSKLAAQKLDPNTPDYKPSYSHDPFYLDMFGDNIIANAMLFLIDSDKTEVRGLAFDARPAASDPKGKLGFLFRLYKDADSLGWYSEDSVDEENYTVINLHLDIGPVRMSQPLFTRWQR